MTSSEETPTILLRRPYPPQVLNTHSQLGGLPSLPDGMAWPTASDGTPYHFIAQIDLSEMPTEGTPLPHCGVLFFFARMDDDLMHIVENDEGGTVLFTDKIGDTVIAPPGDIPNLGGVYGIDFQRNFLFEDELPVTSYPAWKIDPIRTTTISESVARQIDEDTRAAPKEADHPWFPAYMTLPIRDPARAIDFLPADTAAKPFPQLNVMIDRIVRHTVVASRRMIEFWERQISQQPESRPDDDQKIYALQSCIRLAQNWVEWARNQDLSMPPSSEKRVAFRRWMTETSAGLIEAGAGIPFHDSVRWGMHSSVQYTGAYPELAALLPDEYFACAAPWLQRNTDHQMLGFAHRSQHIGGAKREEILLLHLKSDYGVSFMFCDCGELEFWIAPEDLAIRNFDRIRLSTQGG